MKVSPEKKAAFCARLAQGFTVKSASELIGVAPKTAYEWRKNDPAFEADWDGAIELGTQSLEDEAATRATEGKSDTLLIFLLKARRPDVYREKYEHKFDLSGSLARVLSEFRKLDSDGRAAVIAKVRDQESGATVSSA